MRGIRMRATLAFRLPEEEDDFQTAVRARDYRCALSGIVREVRNKVKYGALPEAEERVWSAVQDLIWQTIRDAGVEVP